MDLGYNFLKLNVKKKTCEWVVCVYTFVFLRNRFIYLVGFSRGFVTHRKTAGLSTTDNLRSTSRAHSMHQGLIWANNIVIKQVRGRPEQSVLGTVLCPIMWGWTAFGVDVSLRQRTRSDSHWLSLGLQNVRFFIICWQINGANKPFYLTNFWARPSQNLRRFTVQ